MARKKYIAMIGTSIETMGGISSVVAAYRKAGLFDDWPVLYYSSHADGSRLAKLGKAIRAYLSLLLACLSGKIAIVHVHLSSRASFWRKSLFLLTGYAFGIPSIIHLHGSEFMEFYQNECGSILKKFVRFIFSRAERIIVLSSQWKSMIRQITSNLNVTVIFNPIDVIAGNVAFSDEREKDVLLFLGRMGTRKGIYDLIKAVACVRTIRPDIRLLCGGDGDIDAVSRLASDLNVTNHVQILGWVTGQAKEDVLGRATVFVLPSYAEGLPVSILEAMAHGLPIISTPVGGIPDIIENGLNGRLVPPGDHQHLADAIIGLLADARLRDSMAHAALEKIQTTFSSAVIIPQVGRIYSELGVTPYVTQTSAQVKH
jgi:glycosyltransferase involved in cell wall biosynthesis